jgi:tRNA (adenine22-N1)-methyltransferase
VVVADIGSDHGFLPAYLLQTGRAQRVIVVEKSVAPLERARRALAGRNAEPRLGDGLEPIQPGEMDCLTMTGFGAVTMARILSRHPERVPGTVILQPNGHPRALYEWAATQGFDLRQELEVETYRILHFTRACTGRIPDEDAGDSPVY